MDTQERQQRLQQSIPKALGTLSFDQNNRLVESTGIGKSRVEDIIDISQMELDDDGYGVTQDGEILVNVFKDAGRSVIIYTSANGYD